MLELFASMSQMPSESTASSAASSSPALNVLMTGLLLSCFACWIVAGSRIRNGLPLLAWEPRTSVPWNLIDVLCAIFLQFAAIIGGVSVFVMFSGIAVESMEDPDAITVSQRIVMMMLVEIGMLFAVFLTIGHLVYRARASWSDMGMQLSHFPRDISLGVLGFLMLTMPVLLLQAALGVVFPDANQHPFVDMLREQGDNLTIGLIFIVAVVLAPIIEEFLFRAVIQGWLQRFMSAQSDHGDQPTALDIPNAEFAENQDAERLAQPTIHDSPSDSNPYSPPLETARSFNPFTNRGKLQEFTAPVGMNAWFPIIATSVLFSLAHFGQGTAPVPLFFLSVGLGFLYQRTHRIWPSVVTHMLVNGLAVVQLKIAIDSGIPM